MVEHLALAPRLGRSPTTAEPYVEYLPDHYASHPAACSQADRADVSLDRDRQQRIESYMRP